MSNHKKLLTLLFSLSLTFFLCQKIELKKVTDSSQIFKGEIAGTPVTMQLYFAGIADCSLYQYFVGGWYYYDKYQKKIPLTGIYDYGKLSLYNFGTRQKQNAKIFRISMRAEDAGLAKAKEVTGFCISQKTGIIKITKNFSQKAVLKICMILKKQNPKIEKF